MGVDAGSLGGSVEGSESLTAPVSSEHKAQRCAEREAAPEDREGSEEPEQGVNLHRCHQITQLPECPFEPASPGVPSSLATSVVQVGLRAGGRLVLTTVGSFAT